MKKVLLDLRGGEEGGEDVRGRLRGSQPKPSCSRLDGRGISHSSSGPPNVQRQMMMMMTMTTTTTMMMWEDWCVLS